MEPIIKTSTQVPTGHLGYIVPIDTTKVPTSIHDVPKWFNGKFERSTKAKKPQPSQLSQPVTTNYPNGQWKKVNGEWKQVVSETFIPATTPEEKRDLMNKWLNGIK